MRNEIIINPEVIRWAVNRSGLSVRDFKPSIGEWIRGEKKPTFGKLQEFAKKAMVPFGYLFLAQPPVEPINIPDFRTFRDEARRTFSPNLRDVISDIERRQSWMREYLIESGEEPLDFVGSLNLQSSIINAANAIRWRLGLAEDWQESLRSREAALGALRWAIDAIGIFICQTNQVALNTRRQLDHEEFRGFVLTDEYAPWIFVNSNDAKSAQIFTLAHELVHVWLGKSALVNLEKLQVADNAIERFCNQVAAEFLLPKNKFERVWNLDGTFPQKCNRISRQFKISNLVIARRALELNHISQSTFFKFYAFELKRWKELKLEKKDEKAPVFWTQQSLRLGYRYGFAVAKAYAERKILPSEVKDLTGFKRETFAKYSAKVLAR